MQRRFLGIYGKVFFYTMLILAVVMTSLFFFFSEQLKGIVLSTQRQQLIGVFQSLITEANGRPEDELLKVADEFHQKNRSFDFSFTSLDGRTIYQTENFTMVKGGPSDPLPELISEPFKERVIYKSSILGDKKLMLITSETGDRHQLGVRLSGDTMLYISGIFSGNDVLNEFLVNLVLAFSVIFVFSAIAAAVFARRIASPIQTIAADTKKMANLEAVPAPNMGEDEIGQLAKDVYKMYRTLQETIRQLETEIKREKEMEESQRYFFAAASHELKTPIAAVSAILEGMWSNVIEPEEHQKYLRECLRLMNEQNKLVTEILDIVKMNDRMTKPVMASVDVHEFVGSTLEPFRPLFEAKGQRLEMDVDSGIPCQLDARLFSRAFTNILQNAGQNSPAHSKIKIYSIPSPESLTLCVFNEGIQIPQEKLPKLFEPFFLEDEARSREHEQGRNGLGLTIVKKILDLMEIPFALENVENGVLFKMELKRMK